MNLRERVSQGVSQLVQNPKSFVHNTIELPPLNRVTVDGRRHYSIPGGKLYPSVTTVVGDASKDYILEWRRRVGEEEANRISRYATTRGTRIHSLCEHYVNNDHEAYIHKVPVVDVHTFLSIQPTIDKYIDNIRLQEAPLYSHFLQVAGTVDCVADFDGKLSIIDFKTSLKTKKEEWIKGYFMQTSAYAVMLEEMMGTPVNRLVVIIAVDNAPAQLFVKKRDDYIHDFIKIRNDYRIKYNV